MPKSLDELLNSFDHPLRPQVEMVRKIILSASSSIEEGLKWNSLSFRTTEWFATWNWRVKDQIQLVMHLGAKARDTDVATIPDPNGMLKWLAKDRALLTLNPNDLEASEPHLRELVQAWIKHV